MEDTARVAGVLRHPVNFPSGTEGGPAKKKDRARRPKSREETPKQGIATPKRRLFSRQAKS
jgi:hypothetical protein